VPCIAEHLHDPRQGVVIVVEDENAIRQFHAVTWPALAAIKFQLPPRKDDAVGEGGIFREIPCKRLPNDAADAQNCTVEERSVALPDGATVCVSERQFLAAPPQLRV
jgi:hypothetical protein